MNNIKKSIEKVLSEVADSCHKKDMNDDFNEEIEKIEEFYKFLKKYMENMEEDISLYRYKPINKYTKMEVDEQKIFTNLPSKFDDLFDSNFVVDIKNPDDDFAPRFHAVYLSKFFSENLKIQVGNDDTNGWDVYWKKVNSEIDKLLRVSSLSEEWENIPLWYYYANRYEGICIEYSLKDIVKSLRENEYLLPVIYTDNYFKYNPATAYTPEQTKMSVQSNVLIKHDSWKFEKEWRIVRIYNKDADVDTEEYTAEIPIKSITFGLKTDKYDKQELMNLRKNIDFYEIKRTCYGVKRVKCEKKEFLEE